MQMNKHEENKKQRTPSKNSTHHSKSNERNKEDNLSMHAVQNESGPFSDSLLSGLESERDYNSILSHLQGQEFNFETEAWIIGVSNNRNF